MTQHIVVVETRRGLSPRIAGTRVRVLDVVNYIPWQAGAPSDAATASSISLAEVHAALMFFSDNEQMVLDQYERDVRFEEEFRRAHPELAGAI